MKRYIISSFLLLVLTSSSYSQQIKSFTADTAQYLDEIRRFSGNYIKETEKPVLEKFTGAWASGVFSWDEMKEIVDISNLMLRRYARPSPDFMNYFDVLMIFKTDSLAVSHVRISEWKKQPGLI